MARFSIKLRLCMATLLVAAVTGMTGQPAQADLIFDSTINAQGAGLGAVNTIVTREHTGPGNNSSPEGGCVGVSGGVDDTSASSCLFGVPGTGKIVGINQTVPISDITGLTELGDLALVFNVDEIGSGDTVTLDQLFISVFDGNTLIFSAQWGDGLQVFDQNNGIGGEGFVFILNDTQAAIANLLNGGVLDPTWRVGGGFQLLDATGSNGPETLNVIAVDTFLPEPVPEPASLLIFGLGLLGLMWLVRRRGIA